MLIIDTRQSDSLDRALKVYKKKFEKTGVMRELRYRQAFTKPSVDKRNMLLKAKYRETLRNNEE